MTREEALALIAGDLEDISGVEPEGIAEDKTFGEDLGVDSLTMVEVVVTAEQRFGIKIPDEDIESIKTVGDLVDRAVKP